MKKLLLVVCCLMVMACSPFSNDFEDDGLQKAVDGALRNKNISKKDYDTITHLDLSFKNIESLEGIDQLSGLESLTLANNNISDLSPLEKLDNLKILDIQNNAVKDLSPLTKLDHLEVLLIRNNPVKSIESIDALFVQLKTTDFLVKVDFKDANFEAYIRSILGLETETITFYELEKVRTLDLRDLDIKDLTGISFMGQLEKLIVPDPVIGLEELDHLKHLKHLEIENNTLTSLDFIQNNEAMVHLNLAHNSLSDISVLDHFPKLSYLDLSFNKVESLAPLNDHKSLKNLYAKGNPIMTYDDAEPLLEALEETDVFIVYFNDLQLDSAVRNQLGKTTGVLTLSALKGISHLEASQHGISDLRGIELLENLVSLNIEGNNIVDLEPLKGLEKLSILKGAGNQVVDLRPLVYLNNLEILDLTNNAVVDVSPLLYIERLEYLYLQGNTIEDNDFKVQVKAMVANTDEW